MNPEEIEEYDIRRWFSMMPIDQVRDTLHVCEGIVQVRTEAQPKRKRRKDAGSTRDKDPGSQGLLDR